ncbi:MAG: hypothetical protein ACK5RS_17285, partial [Acidobacteriota bacterium]
MSVITPTTYEEFLELAAQGTVVPLVRTVMADLLTPVSAYLRIEKQGEQAFLLESVEGGEKIARYSFLGCRPHTIVRARATSESAESVATQPEIQIERNGQVVETRHAPMLDVLREMMGRETPVKV